MNKFGTGVIIGTVVALAGAEYMMMNTSARKKMARKGKKVLNKAEDMIGDMSESNIW